MQSRAAWLMSLPLGYIDAVSHDVAATGTLRGMQFPFYTNKWDFRMYFSSQIRVKQRESTHLLPQSNAHAQMLCRIRSSVWTGSITFIVMNHNIEFQCPDLSSSWSPGTQGLLMLLQWNILRLLNNINILQCSVQVRAFGHLHRVVGCLPVHLAILLPVTITSA